MNGDMESEFAAIRKNFEAVGGRFDALEGKFQAIQTNFDDVLSGQKQVAKTMTRVEARLDHIVANMATKAELGVIQKQLDGFSSEILASRGQKPQ